ncbi:MAG: PAS domain S-box protein [Nitrosomonadales bacterium]|nr:PAS domain S-box protein [Nitrosomonadales bacterium]
MKNWNLPKLLNTPLGVVIAMAVSIFGVELLFMVLLHMFFRPMFGLSGATWNIIDAIVLTIVIAPLLYWLVFRKIKEKEDYLRQINAAAQDAIVVVNEQCRIVDWNLAAQKMFQYSREEVLGQQLHRLIVPPCFRADVDHGFARFQENGEGPLIGKIAEVLATRKDGSEIHAELSISAVEMRGGWHAIGIIRDITERKRTEESLRKSAEEIEDLYNHAPCGYHSLDKDGVICRINDTELAWLGYTRDEVVGKMRWPDLITSAGRQAFHERFARCMEQESVYDVEVDMIRKDGTVFTGLVSSKAIYDSGGDFAMSWSTVFDITERKRNEEAVTKAREKFQILFDMISDAILVVGMDGRFIHVNRSACMRLGYSYEELLQLGPADIDTPEAAAMVPERIKAILEQGKLVFETTQVSKDGIPTQVELNSRLVEFDGKPAFLSVARDITERKRMENALHRAKEAAELALAEQRQLVAMISHEYRSPLAVIDSAAQLLEIKLPAESDTAPIIARIRRGVSRLTNFLDNCLTEGRMDSEALTLRSSAIDLHALVASVVEGTQLISESHQLITELDPDLPLLDADPQLLGIMLLNLLGNAIKYSPSGSEVRLRIKRIGQVCSFEVIDQGCGIPADELPFIFQKYMRGRSVTSLPGAGLGLSLVSRIAAQHGGRVEMKSREGEGAHVTVTIPLNFATDREEQLQIS